jgi:hypothetical protein
MESERILFEDRSKSSQEQEIAVMLHKFWRLFPQSSCPGEMENRACSESIVDPNNDQTTTMKVMHSGCGKSYLREQLQLP